MYKIVQSLNVFFIRFHMGPFVERLLTMWSYGSAPLNKMAAMPIYGKILLLQN